MPYADSRNPKRIEYLRLYYKKNKIKINEYRKQWRKNKPELFRAQLQRHLKKPAGIYTRLKHNVLQRNSVFEIDRIEFVEWYNNQIQECTYCGIKKENLEGRYKTFSIDRMDNAIPYRLENIVLSCFRCNTIKNNFFSYQEMKEIAAKYITPKLTLA